MQPWTLSSWPLLLWLLLPWPGSGQLQVNGPTLPIIARARGAAVFPCHLSPPADARNMDLTWYHDQHSVLVHEYRNSRDYLDQQSMEYRGRTELLRENITQGQVALKINPILLGDEGQYSCVFATSTQSSQAQFELLVTASGQSPHIHVQPGDMGGIKLTCSSPGWFPDPELYWRGPRGQPLLPDSEKFSLQDGGLVHVESSVTVRDSSGGDVSCSIRNAVVGEEKEAGLSLAAALFRVSAWTVALAVLLVLLANSLVITGVLFLRSRRAREKKKALQ